MKVCGVVGGGPGGGELGRDTNNAGLDGGNLIGGHGGEGVLEGGGLGVHGDAGGGVGGGQHSSMYRPLCISPHPPCIRHALTLQASSEVGAGDPLRL